MPRFPSPKFTFLLALFLLAVSAGSANAQYLDNISIMPKAIDIDAQAGDLIEKEVVIRNFGNLKTEVISNVEDMGMIPFGAQDMVASTSSPKESLGNWISFFRGSIELEGGEERSFPLKMNIDKNAEPGKYLANLNFSDTRRSEKILLGLEVKRNLIESGELRTFRSKQNVYFKLPAYFFYTISNMGNQDMEIRGEIRIYDRRGASIEDIAVVSNKVRSNESKDFEASWYPNSGFGKYKAVLDLEYGENSKGYPPGYYLFLGSSEKDSCGVRRGLRRQPAVFLTYRLFRIKTQE